MALRGLPTELLTKLRTPREFDQAGQHVRPEDMDAVLRISSKAAQHAEWVAADIPLGLEEILLHNVNTNQEEFITTFAENVLPQLRRIS